MLEEEGEELSKSTLPNSSAISNYNRLIKIVMVGKSQCGKTCLLSQYVSNSFESSCRPSIGVEFQTRMMR
jgi:GTPase SAR1 family protein